MEKQTTNYVTIKCPYCGAEYTLDEIYLAKYITGKSKQLMKDPTGKILLAEFELEPDLTEIFNCDYCHKDFNVDLEIKTTTSSVKEELDFSTESASLI